MNIFYLDEDPVKAAQYMCDKHVVKMIVESAQILSTAHRVLDGELKIIEVTKRKIKKLKTGEVIDLEKIKQAKQTKCIETFDNMHREMTELGMENELKIIKAKGKKHRCISIKLGYTFGKVFRVVLRDLIKSG